MRRWLAAGGRALGAPCRGALLALLALLALEALAPAAATCVKPGAGGVYCNGKNPDADCWCDAICKVSGDCCANICGICGYQCGGGDDGGGDDDIVVQPPSEVPTIAATDAPTPKPTPEATEPPTNSPTNKPTPAPTEAPTAEPTTTPEPTQAPTAAPVTAAPTNAPTTSPTQPAPLPAPGPAPGPDPAENNPFGTIVTRPPLPSPPPPTVPSPIDNTTAPSMPAPPTPTPAAPPPAGGNSSSNSSIPNDSLPPEGVSPFVAGAPWVLDPRWDRVETLAGVLGQPGFADGVGDEAQFANTRGLDVAPDCLRVFIADEKNHKIRVYDTLTAQVTTIAGGEKGAADGCGEAAQFLSPHQLAYAPGEILYVTDAKNNCVRQVDIATGCVTTIGGVCNGDDSTAGMTEGVGAAAQFDTPRSITVNSAGTKVYLGDNNNNRIRQYDVATKTWSTLTDGFGVKIGKPTGLKVSPDGTWLLLCDESSNSVQRVDTATGQLTFMAGAKVDFMTEETHNDGPAETATFWTPRGCTTDGKTVWIPDMRNNALRSLDLGTNMVSTVYGVGRDDPSTGYTPGLPYGRAILDGPVDIARADNPIAVAVCTEEIHGVPTELLFVGDDFTGTLRVVYPKIDAAIYKSNSLP